MHSYITESMARVGCGSGDIKEIAKICDELDHMDWDTLDAMHSFGANAKLTQMGEMARAVLREKYSNDDLICLSAYVNAYRNVVGTYPN